MTNVARSQRVRIIGFLAAIAAMSACGGSGGSSRSGQGEIDQGPAPLEMCSKGEYPIAAAYSLNEGSFQWASCSTKSDMHVVVAATDDDVWLEIPYPPRTIRIDARTGEILETRDGPFSMDLPDDADKVRRTPPVTDDVRVTGGQDDPLVGLDATTGEEIWRTVGIPVYDDVWATDDDGVYVLAWDVDGETSGSWIAAYDVASGTERWRVDSNVLAWPWHVANGRLFAMWFDLQVMDTSDGSILWATSFGQPASGFPRMFGAVTNETSVIVSFTSVQAGGD